jgi:hypothetical protein
MREKLDCASDAVEVQELVQQEPPAFTDYQNFFETVALWPKRSSFEKGCPELVLVLSAMPKTAFDRNELCERQGKRL